MTYGRAGAAALLGCMMMAAIPATAQEREARVGNTTYYQIETATLKKDGALSLQGHWLLPQTDTATQKSKPKIPDFPGKVAYILPPCKSELAQYMDEVFDDGVGVSEEDVDGNKDWCSRLKGQLDAMGMPYVDHEDFY